METGLQTQDPDFDRLLDDLEALSRNHLLYFRMQVGQLLITTFYDGDLAAYRSPPPDKGASFKRFVTERAERLADYGLSEQLLRQSMLAWAVVKELPKEVAERLRLSHVVALTRVHDRPTRSLLAAATVENDWTARALKDAVAAARTKRWIDDDPAPGLQPPAPADPPADDAPQPGRVVTRFERAAADLDEAVDQLERVDAAKLSPTHRERTDAALRAIEARVARARARLRRRAR